MKATNDIPNSKDVLKKERGKKKKAGRKTNKPKHSFGLFN